MTSTKMAFLILFFHLALTLTLSTGITVPRIHIPDTVPYGHPVLKLPCRSHLKTDYTITQYLLGVSQVQDENFEKNSADLFGPNLHDKIRTRLFSLDKDDCLVVTYADLSHWRGRDIAIIVRIFEDHSTVDHNFLVHVLSQPSNIQLEFREFEYLGYILENQRPGSFVHGLQQLAAIASPSSSTPLSPGDITYHILGPASAKQTFSLTTLPDGEVQVFTKRSLDREVASAHAFVVEAVGPKGSFATANVRVDVLDVDDTAPILKKKYYVTVVDTNIPVGTTILRVVARDPDLISEGPPVYSMETRGSETPGNDHIVTPFQIDPSSGIITSIMSPLPVDHYYLFKVFASDHSGHRSASSLVKVIVKKNVPLRFETGNSEGKKLQSPPPSLYVGGGDPSYSSVFQVRRRRALSSNSQRLREDKTGKLFSISVNDPQAKYELTGDPSGWFKVDINTGDVSLRDGQSMDYETMVSLQLEFKITSGAGVEEIVTQQIEILDVNDEPPVLVNKPKPLQAVVTKSMYNQVVFTLRATDKDKNHKIKYRILFDQSKAFEINEDTGEIKLKWGEYLELNTSYTLGVYAEDIIEPKQRSKVENLKIYTGELPPQFYSTNYVGEVQENNQPDQFVQNLTIAVKSFQNRSISFKLKADDPVYEQYFIIKKKPNHDAEANIIVMKAFNYNKDLHMYNMEILAIDRPGLSSTATLSIQILDMNDHPPEFNLHTYTINGIREDVAIGSTIQQPGNNAVQIIATDRDSGENSRITFSLKPQDNFVVKTIKLGEGQYKAVLEVKTKLDYEENPLHEFDIIATDNGVPQNTAVAKVKIQLKNLNNKKPVFPTNSKELTFKITETSKPGTFVGNLKVQDPDGDEVCFYFGNFSNTQGPFEIDPKAGSIKTTALLDKNKPSYTLNVTVTDDGCAKNASAHVTKGTIVVMVEDINNNKPIFKNCSSYNPSIKEKSGDNAFVIQVKASDEDRGSNGEVNYYLLSPGMPFKINQKDGIIRTTEDLSRNKHASYPLLVKAEDGGKPKLLDLCPLVVNIEDINDHAPVFEVQKYTQTISKTDPPGTSLLSVKAVDEDTALNAAIVYSISDNLTYFRIDNEGNIFLNRSLNDYPEDRISFTVKAIDRGDIPKEGTTRVEFKILANAQNPKWLNKTGLTILVSENQTLNVPFARFVAESNIDNKAVKYFLMAGSTPTKYIWQFRVRVVNGAMELLLDKPLDYEKQRSYEMRARATNLRFPDPLTSDLRFTINVTDANDQVPIFKKFDLDSGIFYASVYENQPVNTTVMKIIVEDKDPTENFHKIVYKLEEGSPFTIDQNGVIRTSKMFDREKKKFYDLQISASDNPGGSHINVETRDIRIRIDDINDNKPQFAKSFYRFNVTENTRKGTSVFKLTATDADDSSDLVYSIRGKNVGIFSVDSADGVIRVLNEKILDFENTPNRYNFTYFVSDHINEVSVPIEAVITDMNDNKPVFNQSVYTVTNVTEEDDTITPENKRFLIQVWATDPDTTRNNNITYELESNLGGKYFEIDKLTGKIYLLHKLDRDFMSGGREVYSFIVLAKDEVGPDSLTGVARVNVWPKDINDNPPQFEGSSIGYVPENSAINTPVMQVIAHDMDEGDNGKVQFEITKHSLDGKGRAYFSINPTSGEITVAQPGLDYETFPEHKIDVKATDMGKERLSSTRTYQIFVTDVNDNRPVCKRKYDSVQVVENYAKRIGFHMILADDKDTGVNARLTYSLVSDGSSQFFGVDTVNNYQQGQVVIIKDLDYEDPAQRQFNLTIRVEDPNPDNFDICYLNVTVLDVNDNTPHFEPQFHTVSIQENETRIQIYKFNVTDADSGKNGDINFKIDRKTDQHRQFQVREKSSADNSVVFAEVWLHKPLDREQIPLYKLHVLGIDNGLEPRTGTGTLTVVLRDVNDNYPAFAKDYRPQILEGSPPNPSVVSIKADDPDEPKNGPPFTFWLPCKGSCCPEYTLCDKFGMTFYANSQTGVVSSKAVFDREEQKFYYMPIVMSDSGTPPATGTNTLTIEIGDINDNEHRPGHKDILVYNYEGKYGGFSVGTVFCEDPDDWDLGDKTFTYKGNKYIQEYFHVAKNGSIIMAKGVPDDTYFFQAEVYDKVHGNTEVCNVSIIVRQITEEVVTRSGSIRFEGITPEKFLKIDATKMSPFDKFKSLLAKKLNVSNQNVELFSVMENEPGTVDVRYAAHGSPWYSPSVTNGAVSLNRAEFAKELGLKINMVDINLCQEESCFGAGCTNVLVIGDEPVMINANETSFVGVNTKVVKECICGARDFSEPMKCTSNYCYNGGQCEQDRFGVVKCTGCPPGYTGPRCQKTSLGFSGNGFALFSPLDQCEDSRTSLKFATFEPSGLLFYDGPTKGQNVNLEDDFILLELVNGFPRLIINQGTGELVLSIDGRDSLSSHIVQPLNDAKWHHVDIIRKGREVRLIVDHCLAANKSDRKACEAIGKTPGENIFLNVVEPLQVGGVYMNNPPSYISSKFKPFKGCIKDLKHNSWVYDFYVKNGVNSQNVKLGCPAEEANCAGECSKHAVCESYIKPNSFAKCHCNPGFSGERCNEASTVRDFMLNSFIEWEFRNSFFNNLNSKKNSMQVRFRTRDEEGLLFKVPGSSSSKFMQLMIYESRACIFYDLGNFNGERRLCLEDAEASDGQWHVLKVERFGQEFVLTMDGGEGRFYNDTLGHKMGINLFNPVRKFLVAGAEVIFGVDTKIDRYDLNKTCMNDIRYDDEVFPMIFTDDSIAAQIVKNRETKPNCTRDDCKVNTCSAHQVCIELFGIHKCQCQNGYEMLGSKCIDINECKDSPCFGNATCVNKDGDFKCVCGQLWTGPLCNLPRTLPITSAASLTTGALVAILVSLFIMLILVLFVILLNRNKKPVDKYILEVESDDDIRENVINYDEEGAGEEDQLAYDISRLRKPEPDYHLKPTLDKPVRNQPSDGPDVGNYIDDRIKDADNDDNAPPSDSVREFVYEGSGSDAGSLSSLNTSTGSDDDNDYDALNSWGPKFAKLADMYGAGQPVDD